MVDIEDVGIDDDRPPFLGGDDHAGGEDDDVLRFKVIVMGQEIRDPFDLAPLDPAAVDDEAIVIDVLPFEFLQGEEVGVEGRGQILSVTFRRAGVGSVKNQSFHSERILPYPGSFLPLDLKLEFAPRNHPFAVIYVNKREITKLSL